MQRKATSLPPADERGITLYIALPMALLMVASAWSIMGMGDALWMRQRGQENADSAAFTAAASHAQALNLLAVLNGAMLSLTVIYLVGRALVDILNLILGVGDRSDTALLLAREDLATSRFGAVGALQHFMGGGVGFPWDDVIVAGTLRCKLTPMFAAPYCRDRLADNFCGTKQAIANLVGIEVPVCEISAHAARTFWLLTGTRELATSRAGLLPQYEQRVLGGLIPGMNELERVIARSTPAAGSLRATLVAAQLKESGHEHHSVALSASMLEASTWSSVAKAPAGLPVRFDHVARLCDKASTSFGITMRGALKSTPGIGGLAQGKTGEVLQWTGKKLGEMAADRYCRDAVLRATTAPVGASKVRVWRRESQDGPSGPSYIDRALSNGHAAFATYGLSNIRSRTGSHQDTWLLMQLARFRTAHPARQSTAAEGTYIARAEFYFDCGAGDEGKRTWQSESCNADDAALYRPHWSARLRSMRDPGPIDILLQRVSVPFVTQSVRMWLGQMQH